MQQKIEDLHHVACNALYRLENSGCCQGLVPEKQDRQQDFQIPILFFSAGFVAMEKLSFYFLMMLKLRKIILFFEAAVLCPVSFNSQIILRIWDKRC